MDIRGREDGLFFHSTLPPLSRDEEKGTRDHHRHKYSFEGPGDTGVRAQADTTLLGALANVVKYLQGLSRKIV